MSLPLHERDWTMNAVATISASLCGWVWKTFGQSWKTLEKRSVKSIASVGNGVTVAQQTLTLFVLVRIQVPQPLPNFPIDSVSYSNFQHFKDLAGLS
jgi:hypothetical protein